MNDDEDYKRTIYVGNLPDNVTEQGLFAYFNTFGDIKSIQIPKDHQTSKNRGFAFVQYDEKQDALSAIDNYDRSQFMQKTIKVRKSKPVDLKPDYHKPVWHNDDWLQRIQTKKIENQRITKEQQEKNKALGLPIFKKIQAKEKDMPIIYVEEED